MLIDTGGSPTEQERFYSADEFWFCVFVCRVKGEKKTKGLR